MFKIGRSSVLAKHESILNSVSPSDSRVRGINLLPLRHLLAYQKLRERIIYETCLAGFRLRSVDVGETCISQGNSLEEKTDYSRRQERVWILSARLLLISYEILLKCLGVFFPRFFGF